MNLPLLQCESDHLELPDELSDSLMSYCRELVAACCGSVGNEAEVLPPFHSAGVAQFLKCWSRFSHDQSAANSADALAEAALEYLTSAHVGPHWIGGLTGTTWALRQLSADDGNEDPGFSEAVDAGLSRLLSVKRWRSDFDLIGGLTGYGIYGLEHPDSGWRQQLCGQVLGHLEAMARPLPGGIAWFTSPELLPAHQREVYPQGYFNLGLAHGVPGVIAFLARCTQEDCHAERAESMMTAATSWLLARCERSAESGGAAGFRPYFANIADSGTGSRPLAWCYGDLGVGVSLLRAGNAARSSDWREFALAVAGDCAQRRGGDAGVNDMGLCHGSAGAALIFLRFWQQTGDPLFADACQCWLQQTLEMRDPQYAPSGGVFSIEGTMSSPRKVGRLDLLTGAAGVGLAILSCIGAPTGRWDAPLLTDVAESKGVSS